MWFIYALSDPDHLDLIRYVGKTECSPNTRYNRHVYEAKTGKWPTPKNKWIAKLIRLGRMPTMTILERGDGDVTVCNARERKLIAEHRLNGRLLNLTDGGDGISGHRSSPEQLLRMSQRRKGIGLGRKHSDEARAKMKLSAQKRTPEYYQRTGAARRGKHLSEEHKRRLSAAHSGKTLTPEHRAKIGRPRLDKPVAAHSVLITYQGRTQAAARWGRELGMSKQTILHRFQKGWPMEAVFSKTSRPEVRLGWTRKPLLTSAQAHEIRERKAVGATRKMLAGEYGVSEATIKAILAGRLYPERQ